MSLRGPREDAWQPPADKGRAQTEALSAGHGHGQSPADERERGARISTESSAASSSAPRPASASVADRAYSGGRSSRDRHAHTYFPVAYGGPVLPFVGVARTGFEHAEAHLSAADMLYAEHVAHPFALGYPLTVHPAFHSADGASARALGVPDWGSAPLAGDSLSVVAGVPAGGVPICRYFQQGYCRHGDRCNFSHADSVNADITGPGDNAHTRGAKASATQGHSRGHQRRTNGDGMRYTSLEQVTGKIYALCKDQHGCRFLQRKLEEQSERAVQAVFDEVLEHMVELMSDPFGNYLCQKLIELCNDDQRTAIVCVAAPEIVSIAMNMHGTRSAQRMIECLTLPLQVAQVVSALRGSVVPLIKDLNGNHVVQRCLQHFSAEDAQFIYDAVASHCIEVSTHRHGCCVMQRCIDHATEAQKAQLVSEITVNGLTLVQDPFGNYVVQYVLELKNPCFSDALIKRFVGNVGLLAAQKFSSNVMEKCLRVAEGDTRRQLLDEVVEASWLPRLLQDPYGNYVIQTALAMCDAAQFATLVESIRPHLNLIRHTPYGKKIEAKLNTVSKWHLKKGGE